MQHQPKKKPAAWRQRPTAAGEMRQENSMTDKPLTLAQAREAIDAIMDRVPDKALPKISQIEPATDDHGPCVWFNARSHGFRIGSGKVNGKPHPVDWHRSTAITDLFDREAAQRYEAKWWQDLAEIAAAFAPEQVTA